MAPQLANTTANCSNLDSQHSPVAAPPALCHETGTSRCKLSVNQTFLRKIKIYFFIRANLMLARCMSQRLTDFVDLDISLVHCDMLCRTWRVGYHLGILSFPIFLSDKNDRYVWSNALSFRDSCITG